MMNSLYQYFIISATLFMVVQYTILLSFSTTPQQEQLSPQPSTTLVLHLFTEVDKLKRKVTALEETIDAFNRENPLPNLPTLEQNAAKGSKQAPDANQPPQLWPGKEKDKPKKPVKKSVGVLNQYGDNVRKKIEEQIAKQSKPQVNFIPPKPINPNPKLKGQAGKQLEIVDGKYPQRRITFDDFDRIKLKPTKWSIHPDEATGRLCLPKWKPLEQALAFIHIGKAAGTTMDSMLGTAKFNSLPACTGFGRKPGQQVSRMLKDLKRWVKRCPACFFCGSHNDFHYLEEVEKAEGVEFLMEHFAPVSWIREPASREVSQFYFAQKKTRVIDKAFKFSDWIWKMALRPETIRGTNSLFADGSSGVMWFSGTVADGWVNTGMMDAERIWKEERRRLLEAPIQTLRDAVLNHNKFLWVGIMENWDHSVELLELQGDITFTKGRNTVANRNPNKGASDAEKELLRMAYPMDAAFYKYAFEVNRMKWELYASAQAQGKLDSIWCKDNEQAREFVMPFYFNGTRIV